MGPLAAVGPEGTRMKATAASGARAAVCGAVARGAATIGAIGAFVSPPLSSLGFAVMLAAFAALPSARQALAAALRQPIGASALGLLAVLAAAMLWSAATWPARLDALWGWRHLLLLIVALALFHEPRTRLRFAVAFVVAMTCFAAAALILWKTAAFSYKAMPPGVILRNNVSQGMAFMSAAVFAVALAWRREGIGRLARAALAGAAAVLVTALVVVEPGRSAILGLAVALAAFAVLSSSGRRLAILSALLASFAVVAVTSVPQVAQKFRLGLEELQGYARSDQPSSMGMRAVMWRTTADLIRERPLLGYGLGGLPAAYEAKVKEQQKGWMSTTTTDPHNQYMFLAVEGGVPAVAAFIWLLIAATRQAAPAPWRAVGLALLAAWCTTSLFSSHFQTFTEGHAIALFLGVFLAAGRAQAPPSASSTQASTSSQEGQPPAPPIRRTFRPQGRVFSGSVTPNTLTRRAPTAAARWPGPLSLATTMRLRASSAAKVPTSVSGSTVAAGTARITASRSPGPGHATT